MPVRLRPGEPLIVSPHSGTRPPPPKLTIHFFNIFSLLDPLLTHRYHPRSMKKANGIVLDKPDKPDYRTPSSFRIIVLLETVSKIRERLSALRLASAARSLGLLHPNQCWSLAGLGCFDAVASLANEVRLLQAASFEVSTLFLHVKGGFDNVCENKLAMVLTRGGVSAYLVAWIKSFLSKRQCQLIFQGAPKVFCPVAVGTPQGSPIYPLLFVLYISSLHPTIPQGLAISYVDNFTITVGSDSVPSNIHALQYYFGIIPRHGADLGVAFSVPKNEPIHWRTPKDRSDVSFPPIVLNDMLFQPSQVVRWLGYWLTPTLHSSVHFLRRLALAKASFTTIRQLSAAGKGLSSWCNRKLAFAAILPILTYGCDLFVPDAATLRKLDAFWHVVLRGQLIGFTPPPRVLCTGRPRYHPFPRMQTPPSVCSHPLGLPPFGIQPYHRQDQRICAHLGPGSFWGRSSLSPPWLLQSRPPYFMACPGG